MMNQATQKFRLSPLRTVVTSFNPKTAASAAQLSPTNEDYYEEGDWVLCVSANDATNCIGCALSNGELQLYDKNSLHLLQTYQRDSLATEITFDTYDANLLAATSTDGSLTLFDIRQQAPALEMKMLRPGEEALSVSMGFDGKIAAVGSSKGKIHFFDIRDRKGILGTYSQTHTNEVTRVRFQTLHGNGTTHSTSPLLVSGSEDGLACVFDTSQTTEESALKNILSVQSPIRDVNFFGPTSDAIFCLTGSESLLLYHKDETGCRKDFGTDMRQYLSNKLLTEQSDGIPVSRIEYLVDCHWDPTSQELLLLAGSATGDAGIFQVGELGLSVRRYLHGGHRGVIRSSWHSKIRSCILTVGEDARMCEWSHTASGSPMHIANPPATCNDNQMIIVPRKRQGAPVIRGIGGGKLRRPRSRMPSLPY